MMTPMKIQHVLKRMKSQGWKHEHIDYVITAEKKTASLAEAKDKLEAITNL